MKIGYQGIKGSFSEEAVQKLFPGATGTGFSDFPSVFEAIKKGKVDKAILPIENTIIGSIHEVYDLAFKYGYHIKGETSLKINHNLLGTKDSNLATLKKVYSHPKALMQCTDFFAKNKTITPINFEDTAAAAAFVSIKNDPTEGAIASAYAGATYDLKTLKKNVETNGENYTRFIVVEKKNNQKTGNKSSIVFIVSHRPGALLECLKIFADEGINLTHLESRPVLGSPWSYLFYLDFEHPETKDFTGKIMQRIKPHTKLLKRLGTYTKFDTKELVK